MTEEEERQSSDEQLDFEGSEDEFSKCGKSRITYARALLLEFTEADACRKLPGDFDMSVLSELNAAANGSAERTTSGNSGLLGAISSDRWGTSVPGERWVNHLLTPSKNSEFNAAANASAERRRASGNSGLLGAISSGRWGTGVPGERWDNHLLTPSKNSELNAAANGSVERRTASGNSGLFGAFSSGRWDTGVPGERWDNHFLTPSRSSPWPGNCYSEKSDVESEQSPHESGYNAVFFGQKTPESGPFQLKKSDNPYRPPHCNKKLPQPSDTFSELGVESSGSSTFSSVESNQIGWGCWADSTTANEEPGKIEMIDAKDKPRLEIIDHEISENLWAEISEKQLCECESSLEMVTIDDSQPTFDDLWADILESLRQQEEAELGSTPATDSEVEICLPAIEDNADIIWPDEDSLISVHDMILPYSSMPTLDNDFVEVEKVTASNMSSGIIQNPKSLNGKHFYHQEKNDHVNFITKSNSNLIPYMPTLNVYTCSNFLYPSCLNYTKPITQYSLFQQPNICPMQQNQPLTDTWCGNQQARYQGFRRSNAGGFCR